ncbi:MULTISPECIES: DMT family transporter [unclassified Knoellia]|uniref:DMT family transporter n=1 Tax=Knoellia altitudinis TaxID=3404795 RepID=UPI00360CA520
MSPAPRVPWQAKYLALALIWGSSFLLMKIGLESLHPVQIATLRLVAGTATILVLLWGRGGSLPTERRTWAHLVVTGVFLGALPFTLFALSETRISSALAGIGNASTPIATVLMTMLMMPGTRTSRPKLAAVLVGFLGVITIMQPWNDARPDLVGFAMALAGGASYGVGWTYNRRFLAGADLGGLSQPAATLLMGTVVMLPLAVVWGLAQDVGVSSLWAYDTARLGTSALDAGHTGGGWAWLPLVCVLVLGAVGTGAAYILLFDVVRAAGAVVGSTITYLIPVVSVLLGVALLGESLGIWELAGFVIVLAAAGVINAPERAPAAEETAAAPEALRT